MAGNVDDSVATSTTFTFDGRTERFAGFNKPLQGVGLYDLDSEDDYLECLAQRR